MTCGAESWGTGESEQHKLNLIEIKRVCVLCKVNRTYNISVQESKPNFGEKKWMVKGLEKLRWGLGRWCSWVRSARVKMWTSRVLRVEEVEAVVVWAGCMELVSFKGEFTGAESC